MAKKIAQFRFYSDGDERNRPENEPAKSFIDGTVFSDLVKDSAIVQLGIQGLPGTKFYINGSTKPITIGASGIYDLDIKNGIRITELNFWQKSIENIDESNTGYLIVDILYGEED